MAARRPMIANPLPQHTSQADKPPSPSDNGARVELAISALSRSYRTKDQTGDGGSISE